MCRESKTLATGAGRFTISPSCSQFVSQLDVNYKNYRTFVESATKLSPFGLSASAIGPGFFQCAVCTGLVLDPRLLKSVNAMCVCQLSNGPFTGQKENWRETLRPQRFECTRLNVNSIFLLFLKGLVCGWF